MTHLGRPTKQNLLVVGAGEIDINTKRFRVTRMDQWEEPRKWNTWQQDEVYDFAIVLPTAVRGKFFWEQLAWRVHIAVTVISPDKRDIWDLNKLYSNVHRRQYRHRWAIAHFSEFRDYRGVDARV